MVGMELTHWDLELVDECWSPRSFYRVNWGPGLADFSFFLGTLRNVWPSPEEVWDLWFNLGSHAKAKDLSHLPLDQTGKSSILIRGVVSGLQQDDYNPHALQIFFSFGLMRGVFLPGISDC